MQKMDKAAIERKRQELIERDGPWTSHNIQLRDDVYTISNDREGASGLNRFTQIIADVAGPDMSQLRCLDLACLEGQYGIELAQQGASVVGLEGRRINLDKAELAKEALGLDNIEFVEDDVRNLSRERYGSFDVVLCVGILYHLDAPDVFAFIENMAEVCTHALLIDTHISIHAGQQFMYKGREYWGSYYVEDARAPIPQWAAIGNSNSVWLTRRSLLNALTDYGFTSAFECYNPVQDRKPYDRITLLALKGKPVTVKSNPWQHPDGRWPEQQEKAPRTPRLSPVIRLKNFLRPYVRAVAKPQNH